MRTAEGPLDAPAAMAIRGTATISGFEYADPSLKEPVRDLAATLALDGDRAELRGLTASLGRSRVSGTCSISRFARPVLDVNLVLPLLDIDEILSFLPASGPVSRPASSAPSGTAVDPRRDHGTRQPGRRRSEGDESEADPSARARLELVRGVARLHEVQAALYGGTLGGEVTAGLIEARAAVRHECQGAGGGLQRAVHRLLEGPARADPRDSRDLARREGTGLRHAGAAEEPHRRCDHGPERTAS